jgi:hypothetical protein
VFLISRFDYDITNRAEGKAVTSAPALTPTIIRSNMARATRDDSARLPIISFVLIDLALFFAAGVLGSFAIACIV